MIGSRVHLLIQGNCMPPHDRPTRTLVVLQMNMTPPTQSTWSSDSHNEIREVVELMQKGTNTRITPQKGKLIQKTQWNEARSAKALPTKGPITLPTAHVASTKENHLGRCLRGTRPENIIWTRV